MDKREQQQIANEISAQIQVWSTVIIAIFLVALLWVFYLLRAFADFDVISYLKGSHQAPASVYLGIAIAGTIIAVPWTLLKLRKVKTLAKVGVRTTGVVTRVGLVSSMGRGPVTVKFTVNGVEYTKRQDVKTGFAVGDKLDVIYDPSSPRTCELQA